MIGPAVHPALLDLLRGAHARAPVSGREWEKIVDDAEIHCLTPFLYRRLKATGSLDALPADVADRLERRVFGLAARSLMLSEELRSILQAFEDRGVPCAPVRGPALAERLYGDVTARPCGDLDLIVRKEHLAQVRAILETLGFRHLDRRAGFAQAFSYTLGFVKDRHGWIVIEPHWTIAYPPFTVALDMEQVWRRMVRERVVCTETWGLSREDLLLHLCLHLMHPDDGAPLLWLSELDRLLRVDAACIDWRRLVDQAREAKLDFLVFEALWRVQRLFETTPIPDDLLADRAGRRPGPEGAPAIRWLIRTGRAAGREEVAVLLTLPGVRVRLRYALGLLFPSRDFMRIQHGVAGPVQLARAYLARVARLSGLGLRVLGHLARGPLRPGRPPPGRSSSRRARSVYAGTREVFMNMKLLVVLVLAAALTASVSAAHAQNVTCNKVGNQVFCSNGQTFFQQGNITLDNQGHVWTNLGNQTLGSQGDLYTRQGNQVFDNHGNSYNIIDSQQVGPSGNKCAQIGNQVFCRK